MSLEDLILHPIEPHIHGFGQFYLDGVVYDAVCVRVVCIHGCGLLWMAHFFKGDSDWFTYFGVVEPPPPPFLPPPNMT